MRSTTLAETPAALKSSRRLLVRSNDARVSTSAASSARGDTFALASFTSSSVSAVRRHGRHRGDAGRPSDTAGRGSFPVRRYRPTARRSSGRLGRAARDRTRGACPGSALQVNSARAYSRRPSADHSARCVPVHPSSVTGRSLPSATMVWTIGVCVPTFVLNVAPPSGDVSTQTCGRAGSRAGVRACASGRGWGPARLRASSP